MPRPREFNSDNALDQAMRVFWKHGYEATSVRDLVSAMNISTSTMYEFFGDKHAIYLTTLARYCQVEQQQILDMARATPSPRAFVEMLFATLDNLTGPEPAGTGSFAFNAMVEFGTRDPHVAAVLLQHYFKIVEIIASVIGQAQHAGLIAGAHPPLHLAHTIIAALQGMAMVKNVQADFPHHRDVVATLLSLLD